MYSMAVTARIGRPPGADGEATRETILKAALEAFAEAGYEAMSVRALARRLGVSHNLIHHHFESKRQLWYEAIDFGLGRRASEIRQFLEIPESNPQDAITGFCEGVRRFILLGAHLPAIPRILLHEFAEGGERLDYIYEQHLQPLVEGAIRFLKHLGDAKAGDIDARSFILLIGTSTLSLFNQSAFAEKIGGPDPFSEETVERHIRTVTRLVLTGVLAEPLNNPFTASGSHRPG